MPLTGMGLGAILASIEIPIAVTMAGILLGEPGVGKPVDWCGLYSCSSYLDEHPQTTGNKIKII